MATLLVEPNDVEMPVNRAVVVLTRLSLSLVASMGLVCTAAVAASPPTVTVSDAWVRPAVKGQSGTGGFMRLLSPRPVSLVGFATPVAGAAELHEMSMEGDVMRMRALPSLALPAGQVVDLQPGGHHLMLMNLKKPLKVGEKVGLTLIFKGGDGKTFKQQVMVPVMSPAQAPKGPAH